MTCIVRARKMARGPKYWDMCGMETDFVSDCISTIFSVDPVQCLYYAPYTLCKNDVLPLCFLEANQHLA